MIPDVAKDFSRNTSILRWLPSHVPYLIAGEESYQGLDLGFTAVRHVEFPQLLELHELSLRITKTPLRQVTCGATVGVFFLV